MIPDQQTRIPDEGFAPPDFSTTEAIPSRILPLTKTTTMASLPTRSLPTRNALLLSSNQRRSLLLDWGLKYMPPPISECKPELASEPKSTPESISNPESNAESISKTVSDSNPGSVSEPESKPGGAMASAIPPIPPATPALAPSSLQVPPTPSPPNSVTEQAHAMRSLKGKHLMEALKSKTISCEKQKGRKVDTDDSGDIGGLGNRSRRKTNDYDSDASGGMDSQMRCKKKDDDKSDDGRRRGKRRDIEKDKGKGLDAPNEIDPEGNGLQTPYGIKSGLPTSLLKKLLMFGVLGGVGLGAAGGSGVFSGAKEKAKNITSSPTFSRTTITPSAQTLTATLDTQTPTTELSSLAPSDAASANTLTASPTASRSALPTDTPSFTPTANPNATPTATPSDDPLAAPTAAPTPAISTAPMVNPSAVSTVTPMQDIPSLEKNLINEAPSYTPTATVIPTVLPSGSNGIYTPSARPSVPPTVTSSATVTVNPSASPTAPPTNTPTASPSASPMVIPSEIPSYRKTSTPSDVPSNIPSDAPIKLSSDTPSDNPSDSPTFATSEVPSYFRRGNQSITPNASPSAAPSTSDRPSDIPSPNDKVPTSNPAITRTPTSKPFSIPTSLAPTSKVTIAEKIINFDDFSANVSWGYIGGGIGDGGEYLGLNWTNWAWTHRHRFYANESGYGGFESGTVSGNYSSYNGGGYPCFMYSPTQFSVLGLNVTSAEAYNMHVELEGFDSAGIQKGSRNITLPNYSNGTIFVDISQDSGFCEINKFMISTNSTGQHFNKSSGYVVVIDNLILGKCTARALATTSPTTTAPTKKAVSVDLPTFKPQSQTPAKIFLR